MLENQIGHVISVVTKFKSKLASFEESFEVESLNDRHGDADVSLNTGKNAKDMTQGELNGAIKGVTANAATGGIASFEKVCDQFGKTPVADESLSSGYLTHLKNAFTGFFNDDDDINEENKESNASTSDNNIIEEAAATESVMGDMASKSAKNHLKNAITGFFSDDDIENEDDEEVEDNSEISASENITEETDKDKEEESVIGSIAKAAVKEALKEPAILIPALVIGGATLAVGSVIGIGDKFTEETEKNLTKAKEYEAEVDKTCEQITLVGTNLEAVRTNCDEITYIIEKLVEWFEKYKVYNIDDEDKLKHMLVIGKTLKDVINEPLINKDGTAVKNLKDKCSEYLRINYSKFSQTKII